MTDENINSRKAAQVATFYDEEWRKRGASLNEEERERAQNIVAAAQSVAGVKSILDVGCGRGWMAEFFPGTEYSGVDFSQSALEAARARFSSGRFLLHPENKTIPDLFPGETFDLVLCSEVIEHVVGQQDFMNEIARMVKPSGHLLMTTPNRLLLKRYTLLYGKPSQPVENWLAPRELKRMAEKAGLSVVLHRGFNKSFAGGRQLLMEKFGLRSALDNSIYQLILCRNGK